MADGKDIAWQPIALCVGTGIACLAIGTFLVAPALQKYKAKKLAEKKKEASGSMKKAA